LLTRKGLAVYGKPGDDSALLRRYHAMQDLSARDDLVRRYLPLVRTLAKRYSYTSEPLDDLCQVGAMALCKAIDRYRPGCGASFKAYAVPTIVGELRRHFRDRVGAVHVPRGVQELAVLVGRTTEAMTAELGRTPTPRELAERTGRTVEEIVEAVGSVAARRAQSLTAADEADEPDRLAVLGDLDPGFEQAEDRAALAPALANLDARDRRILHLRFAEGLSQSEIAARVGISQMHVSRLLRRALQRLHEELETEE
jgi:RNA polymerase sigma-B factor